jgi:hypothetical protein
VPPQQPAVQGLADLAHLVNRQYARRDARTFHAEFSRRDATGQNPHVLFVGCSDSFCGGWFESIADPHLPDRVFKGDNPGAAIMTRSWDERVGHGVVSGTAATAYFVHHIANLGGDGSQAPSSDHQYVVVVEGHTMCGAMGAILAGFDGEDPGLYAHLDYLRDELAPTIEALLAEPRLEPGARAALLAQAAVDIQIRQFMQVYPNFVASGTGHIVGMMRDLTNHMYTLPNRSLLDVRFSADQQLEDSRRGHVYAVNVNGITDTSAAAATLSQILGPRVRPEAAQHMVRRITI